MRAVRTPVRAKGVGVPAAPPGATPRSSVVIGLGQWLAYASHRWLPRVGWSLQRTGRLGLSGAALLTASAVFLLSTYVPLAREVDELRAQAESQLVEAPTRAKTVSDPSAALLRSLPPRIRVPSLLGMLLKQADAAHLSIDTGKYEATVLKSGGVTSYQVSFPVTGPYPQVRQFIDATLNALPTVALSELALTRKTIGDASVEAQIRLTLFTRESP